MEASDDKPGEVYSLGAHPRDIDFLVLRSLAIEQYANIEQALCRLFSDLMQAPLDRIAIVFFRINNTRSRNSFLQQLLKKEHGDKYDLYWHGKQPGHNNVLGMMGLINYLDDTRNKIVHWNLISSIDFSTTPPSTKETLAAPNYFNLGPNSERIDKNIISDFIQKANFVSRSINMFSITFKTSLAVPDSECESWRNNIR